MATSGPVATLAITPAAAGRLIVTATYEAWRTGGGPGNAGRAKLDCTQDGITTSGQDQAFIPSTDYVQFTGREVFDVVASMPVTVRLFAQITGATSLTIRNVGLSAELIKL